MKRIPTLDAPYRPELGGRTDHLEKQQKTQMLPNSYKPPAVPNHDPNYKPPAAPNPNPNYKPPAFKKTDK